MLRGLRALGILTPLRAPDTKANCKCLKTFELLFLGEDVGRLWIGLMFVLATLLAGCGPVVSGVDIVKANVALSAAREAGADKHALYELSAARAYLEKAREEHGYADFAAAREYARKALNFAKQARRRARMQAGAEQPMVLPDSLPPAEGEEAPALEEPPPPSPTETTGPSPESAAEPAPEITPIKESTVPEGGASAEQGSEGEAPTP